MSSRQRRVRAIELTLTPQEAVLVWLRSAMQGTMEEAARAWPPPRGAVENLVLRNVRESMKGEPDPVVERAILQARRHYVRYTAAWTWIEHGDRSRAGFGNV